MMSFIMTPTATRPDLELQLRFRRVSSYLIGLVALLAFLGIVGWEFDVYIIRHPVPDGIAMNPLSSICLLTSALSFFLLRREKPNQLSTFIGYGAACVPIGVGLVRIFEIVYDHNFQLDQLFYYDEFTSEASADLASHIALTTAFTFILTGITLLLLKDHHERARKCSDVICLAIGIISLFAILGSVYGVTEYNSVLSYLPVAIQTAISLFITSIALILVNSGEGLLKALFRADYGGTLARILVPAAIIIPILLGYLRLYVQWKFPISLELGTSYLIIGIILLFFSLIIFTSHVIGKKDKERKAVEEQLRESHAMLEQKVIERTEELIRNERVFRALIEQSADAIVLTDEDIRVHFQSPGAERMTGISLEQRIAHPEIKYTHPEELQIIQQAIADTLANPAIPIPFQSRFLHKDGHYIWIEGMMTNLLQDKYVKSIAFNYRDVTERKKLEERQLLFASMVDSSDDAIISITLEGNIITWNHGAETLYGFKAEDVIGTSCSIIVPGHLQEEQKTILSTVRIGISTENLETERVTKDGKIVFISLTVSPIFNTQGLIVGASKIAHNISERREAQKKLSSSEKRFRALIENISDAIVLNDETLNLIYQSPSVERLLGYTAEERTGQSLINYIHPEYHQRFREMFEKLKANPGWPTPFLSQIRHKNGHYLWIEGVITNLLHDPNVKAFVANYRDITDRKQTEDKLTASETRFRSLIENSSDGIAMIDGTKNVIYRSPAAYRIGGRDPDGVAAEVAMAPHPDYELFVNEKLKQAIDNPGTGVSFEARFMHSVKEFFWLEGTITNLLDVTGVNSVVINFHEITERKNAEAQIYKLNEELEIKVAQRTSQLEVLNKELEAFTYSVSHDLRAPLRIINGFSQILLEDYTAALDEAGRKTLNAIMRNATRMGLLIDDLLEFSRVGRKELRFSRIDVNELVADVIQDMRIGKVVTVPERLTIHPLHSATGDMGLLRQVLVNLISNAIKYSSKKSDPEIEIGMRGEDGSDYYYVRDNGAGFDMQYSHKLFGVFQRLHKNDEFEGTGVGLALVKRIISRHGGTIKAESEVNNGATFYFMLPGEEEILTRANGRT